MLINLLRDEAPTHVAVAFDVSRITFRSERFSEYKANRSSTPDDFRGQVDLIKDVLTALAIPFFAVDNYEADDIIATLATQAEAQGYRVLVTTGDRDAFQLVSDNVTVLYPTRGVSELGRIDPAAVMTRYGLTPGPVPGLRGAARRPQRQPAQHPGRRREDGRQVGARVRLAGGAHGPGRRGEGQGGRRPAREPRARAAQPPAHRADPRRPAGGGARTTSWPARGTARPCTGCSTSWSSGCCASACSPR